MCECYATASCSLSMAEPLALTELQRHAIESGDVGCGAHSAKRHSIGNVPSMTAMVVGSAKAGVYMPFSALALVEFAQAAIKKIAVVSKFALPAPSSIPPHAFNIQSVIFHLG